MPIDSQNASWNDGFAHGRAAQQKVDIMIVEGLLTDASVHASVHYSKGIRNVLAALRAQKDPA